MKNLNRTKLYTVGRKGIVVFLSTLLLLMWSFAAQAQRGVGDGEGVAQQMLKPPLVHISGKLKEIKSHPCENSTGKADLGTHLILKNKQGRELNIHLGPTPELSETVKRLNIGSKIELIGFRTDKMTLNQYVAKILIFGGNVIQLRDSGLRPYWAGSGFDWKTFLPDAKTDVDQRTAMRRGRYYYSWPKSWQRHCFQNEQRPRRRQRCRGRFFCREW
ncbi:MAG: hypothetical protein GY845_19260 [Planctomycetes bacterium]|nr:hypothetical protein [Planctomycetota bacterium]